MNHGVPAGVQVQLRRSKRRARRARPAGTSMHRLSGEQSREQRAWRPLSLSLMVQGATPVQPWSWVTDIRGRKRPVSQRMRGGRARWNIATAPCNTLQHQGDHCEHNDGHGAPPLSVVGAKRRRLAFWVDQAPQRCCALCQAVWAKLGRTRLVGERRRAWGSPSALASMRPLCEALFDGLHKPTPVFGVDATSAPARPFVTACHRTTRRLASGAGTVRLDPIRRLFSACPPRMAHRKSRFKRRYWMGETLCPLSTALGLTGLLDYERELLDPRHILSYGVSCSTSFVALSIDCMIASNERSSNSCSSVMSARIPLSCL